MATNFSVCLINLIKCRWKMCANRFKRMKCLPSVRSKYFMLSSSFLQAVLVFFLLLFEKYLTAQTIARVYIYKFYGERRAVRK